MAQPLTEPLRRRHDSPKLRLAEIAHVGVPQPVLRLGDGPTVKPTTRRPLSDVVILEE
jgi:hypothetical protein